MDGQTSTGPTHSHTSDAAAVMPTQPPVAQPGSVTPPAELETRAGEHAGDEGGSETAEAAIEADEGEVDAGYKRSEAHYFSVRYLKQPDFEGLWETASRIFPTFRESATFADSLREGRHASIKIYGEVL